VLSPVCPPLLLLLLLLMAVVSACTPLLPPLVCQYPVMM
jgi:hypothetical protein